MDCDAAFSSLWQAAKADSKMRAPAAPNARVSKRERSPARLVPHIIGKALGLGWLTDRCSIEWTPNNGLANGGEVLGNQRHGTPSACRRGSQVVRPIQPEHCDLSFRYFDPADLHLRLIGIGREEDQRPLPARRYSHDPRQALVNAMHPQAMQVDARRLRAELAALRDHPVDLQVADPCKIHIGIGKCANGTGRHPHPLGDQGSEGRIPSGLGGRLIWINRLLGAHLLYTREPQRTKPKYIAGASPRGRRDLKSHIRLKRAVKFS